MTIKVNTSSNHNYESKVRSYVNLGKLEKFLALHDIASHRHLVVKDSDNKWTAIFFVASLAEHDIPYLGYYAQLGFMTV